MIKRILRFLLKLFIACIIISAMLVIIYRFVNPPVTILMIQRVIEQKQEDKTMKLKKDWEPIENISPSLVRAVIASEDGTFTDHFGFDVNAIQKAYEYNRNGKRVKGGSTITQQVAKNVFLWPSRSWLRKGLEAYFTLLIEVFWSKERIMEVYLNVIEMGDGIYGAEKAAQIYFNKPAKQLTKSEAALIAAVLPNPRKWSPVKPNAYILKRQYRILRVMKYVADPGY
jgi:monofunctional glycosyltransferase